MIRQNETRRSGLTTRKKLKALMGVPGKWIDRVPERCSPDKLILDLNSPVSQIDLLMAGSFGVTYGSGRAIACQ